MPCGPVPCSTENRRPQARIDLHKGQRGCGRRRRRRIAGKARQASAQAEAVLLAYRRWSGRSINRLSIASALHGAVQCYRLCRNSHPEHTMVCAQCGRDGSARLGSARPGSAWLGSARLGSARLGPARLGPAWLGSARPGMELSSHAVSCMLPRARPSCLHWRSRHSCIVRRCRAHRCRRRCRTAEVPDSQASRRAVLPLNSEGLSTDHST